MKQMNKIKAILNDILGMLYLRGFITAVRSLKILELDYGHFASSQKWQSIDGRGQPIPRFTYPAIEYLKSQDLSNKSIFEFGSGNSTIFWSHRAKNIVSVENNTDWFNKIADTVKQFSNAIVLLRKKRKDYIDEIDRGNKKYDIIVIDGVFRENCSLKAVRKLKRGGIIILDNSDRYPKICRFLRTNNLIEVDFTGFSPINPYISTTSFFIDRNI